MSSSVIKSYSTGYATRVDEQERRGGPHFNSYGNSTFSHTMVVVGVETAQERGPVVWHVDVDSSAPAAGV